MTPNEEAALEELVWELTAPHTPQEIASRLGITDRSVLRIEERALAKLRRLAVSDWEDGLKDPPTQHRRCDEPYASDGRSPNRIPE